MLVLMLLGLWSTSSSASSVPVSQKRQLPRPDSVQKRRLVAWQEIVQQYSYASLSTKLAMVNRFVNQFEYRADRVTYGNRETWATPYEFLMHNGGDCEDFAITKYFLLRSLGVPEKYLQITYVYHRQLNQYHMVLVYKVKANGQGLVLDNLTNHIQTLANRTMIEPIYGFNRRHFWVLDRFDHRTAAGNPDRLSRWQGIINRIRHQPIPVGIDAVLKG